MPYIPTTSLLQGGAGAVTQIFNSTLGSAQATFDVTSIPSTYNHLLGIWHARGTNASQTVNNFIRFNGDSAAHYDYIGAAGGSGGQTGCYIGDMSAANAAASNPGAGFFFIQNYAGTSFFHMTTSVSGWLDLGTGSNWQSINGLWEDASAINRVTMVNSAGNFATGSHFSLYGIS